MIPGFRFANKVRVWGLLLAKCNMLGIYPCTEDGVAAFERRYGDIGLIAWDAPMHYADWGPRFFAGLLVDAQEYNAQVKWTWRVPIDGIMPGGALAMASMVELPAAGPCKRSFMCPKGIGNEGSGFAYPCWSWGEKCAKRQRTDGGEDDPPDERPGEGSGGSGGFGGGGDDGGDDWMLCWHLVRWRICPWRVHRSWLKPLNFNPYSSSEFE